ncbi:hypothetical protein MMPV_005817 [Pyropia vietnamensis]
MLEGIVADVLARVLGQYVLGIDRDSVRVGVWSGRLELGRLCLRAEALATLFESLGLDLPVVVSSGTLQSLSVDVPWKRLGSEPVKVSVRSLALVAVPVIAAATGPAAATADARAEREARLKRATLSADDAVREAKWSVGADPTATAGGASSSSAAAPGALGAKTGGRGGWGSSLWGWRFTSRIVARIVDNIQVDLQDVTVRYEDAASVPSAPFALHASLGALRACSTDASWSEVFLQDPLSPVVHKRVALSELSVVWVPLEASSSERGDEDAADSASVGGSPSSAALTHPTPPSEAEEQEASVEPPRHYLVQPVSAEMRVAITKAWAVGRVVDGTIEECADTPGGERSKPGCTRQARVSLDVRCSSVGLTLAGEQYSTLLRAVLALSDLERRSPPRTPRERWAWAVERLLPRFRQRRAAAARFNEVGLRNWRLLREQYVDTRVRLLHARRVTNVEEDPVDRELVERIEADLDARDIIFFRDLADEAAAKAAASVTAAAEPIASATSRLWSVFSRSRSASANPVEPSVGVLATADASDGDGSTLSAGMEVEARDEDASLSMPNEDAPSIAIPEPPDGSVSRSTSAAALGDADTLSHDDPGDGDSPWNGGESMADAAVTPNLRVVFGLQRGSLRLQRYGAVPDPLADVVFRDLRVELETRPGAGLLLEALLGTFEVWDAQCNTKVVYARVPWAPQGVAGDADAVDALGEGVSSQRPPTMCSADERGVSSDGIVDDVDGSALKHHLMDSEAYGAVDVSDALRAIRGGLHPSELLATGWQQSSSPPSSVVGVAAGGGSGSVASSAYTSSSPAHAEDLTDDDTKARPLRHIVAMRLSRDAGADAKVLSGSTRLALELAVGGVEMLLSDGPDGALAGVATFFSPRHTSPSVMAFLSAAAAPRLAAIRMEVQRALLERSVPPRLDVVIRGPRLLVPGPAAGDPAAVVDLGTFAMDTAPPAELPPLSLHAALSARSVSPSTRSRRPLSASRLGGAALQAGQSELDARDLLQKHSRPVHWSRGRSVDSDRLDVSGRVDTKAVEYTDYRVAVSDLGIFLVPSLSQLTRAQRLVRPFSVHLRLHVLHNASFVEATAAEGQRSALARLRLRGRVPALRVYLSHGAYRQLLTIARGWKAVLSFAGVSPVDGVGGDGDSENAMAESASVDDGEAVVPSTEGAAVPERIQQLDVELALGDASLELRERTGRRLITVEAAGSRLQAVRGRSGFSLRYALRSLTVTDGSRGGTAPFRRLIHAGVGNSHRGVSPPRSLPAFLGSPGASAVPTPVGGVTRSSSYNSLVGVEAGEPAASASALSSQAGVAADVAADAAGGVSGRLPPWPRGGLSSTLRSASGEPLVGPMTELDRDFIKVVYSLDASRREQSLKVRILSLHVVCVRETYLSVVKFFYLFDETPSSPASPGLADVPGQPVEGSAQYSDPFAAVGTTTSAAARRLAAKAERGLERGAATLARRGRLRLDAKLDGVSVDLISAEGALASLDVFSFRAGLRLDPSGAVVARGALAGFTVRDLTAAFPGHSSTVVYERPPPHGDGVDHSSGEGGYDRDVPDGFVCDSVDPHDVGGDAEDAEDGFTLIIPSPSNVGDVWLCARMTNLRIVYLQRFVFIVNTYFAALRDGLAPVLQMQGGLSEIFDSSEPAREVAPEADDGEEATTLAGGVRAGALEDGSPARHVKPNSHKRERRRLRLHVVTKGVDIVIPRHSQNAHEAVRLIIGHSVVSNEEAASCGYRLGLKLTAKGVNLYVLYPSLCKSSTSGSGSAEHVPARHNDAGGGSSDDSEELRPIIPGESVDGYTPISADIYSEILVDWWRTGRVPRFTYDAQGIPVLVRMPSSPARAKRASENHGGDSEQSQDTATMLPALRLRFSAPHGISANLCEAEYTILYLTVTENFLERPDIEFTDIVAGLRTPVFPYRSPIPPLSLSSAPVPPNYRILFTVPVLRSTISHGGDPTAESARLISSTLTDVVGRFDYGIDCRIIFELSADLAGVDDARVGTAVKGAPRTFIMPMLAVPSDERGTFGSRAAAGQPSGSASSATDNLASQAKTVSVSYDRPFGYRSNIMVAVSELRIIVVPELFRDLGLLTPPGLPYLVSTAPPPKARFNGRHVILTLARPEVWLRADQGPADQRALVLRGDVVVAKLEWAPVTMLISVDVVARAIRIGLTNVGVPEQAVPSGPGPWSGSSSSYPLTAVVSPPAAFGHSRDNAGSSASSSNLTERETPLLYPSDISVEFNVSNDASPSPPGGSAESNGSAAATATDSAAPQPGESLPAPTRSLTITAESLLCRLDVHDTPLLLAVFSCFGRMSPSQLKLRPAEVELREAARLRALAAGGGGHRTVRQPFHLASEDDGLLGADDYDDEVVSCSGSDAENGEESAIEDAVAALPERLLSVFFSMPHARLLFTDETSGRYVPILEVRFRQTVANANVPWMASISTTIAVDLFSEARGVWEAGVEPFSVHAAFSHGASGSRAVVVRVAGRLDVNVSPTTVHGAARVATAISSAIQELRPVEPASTSPSSTGSSSAPGILVPGTAGPSTPPGPLATSSQPPGSASRGGVSLVRSVSAGGGGVSSAASSLRRPSVAAFCIRNDTGRPLVIWLPYDSTRRSLGSGREREVDVPTDELLLRAAAAAGRFDDADRARREALRCILALPGFEPVDVSAADVGIRTITLFPEQALSGQATSPVNEADDGADAGMSPHAGPAAVPIVVAWDVQMRDGVPIGTVRSVMRIINRTRTLLEVAIGAPPARSRYNYLQTQASEDAGGNGRPIISYSGGGCGEQHLIRPDSSWAVPIYAVDRPLRIRPAIFHAPDSGDDDVYGRSPQRGRDSSNGLPGDAAGQDSRSGIGVLYSYEWSDPLLSVANQCSLASRIRLYDSHVKRHGRKSGLAAPVAGARKSAGSTLPDGPRWQPISSPGVAEWHSRGVPAASPPSSTAKGPGPIAPVLACRAAIHGPAFHLAVHPVLCRQKPRRASPARYSSSSAGPSAAAVSLEECVDVSLRAPLLVDNTLPRSVSYKLAPVSSSGRAGAAVATTASALVHPLRTEHIHAVGRDVSAFALALGYDNRPVAVVRASGVTAAARDEHESSADSALHARSEWSQCASGYRLTLYSEFWVRNRSDTPILLRERSSSSDIVGTGGTVALRARPPGVPADSYVCFSSGWISLRRAEVAPAAHGGGNADTLVAAGDPWVSVSEELSDVDKPVQLFLGRGASVSVDVRPASGRFGRTLIATIRNVAWLNNSTNSAIQWCQPTTLTSRGIALSSMVHTLAVGETRALHWDRKESHSASREICLRFVDSESGTSDWIWSRPIPVLAAKRGGGIAGDVAAKMYRPKRHEQYIARVSRSLLADGSPVVRVLREDRSSPPYRVVNACASRSIAFRQAGVNETHPWLVRPGKSTRYAWDDPHAPRKRRLLIVETIEHVDDEDTPSSSVTSSESRTLAGSSSSGRHSRGASSSGGLKDQSPLAAAGDRGGGGNSSQTKSRSRRSGGDSTRDVHRPKFELSIDMVTADAGELCRTPRTFDPPMCISVAVQGPTKVVTFSDGTPRVASASSGSRSQGRRPSTSAATSSLAASLPHPTEAVTAVPKRSTAEQVPAVGDAGIPTIDLASLLGDAPDTSDVPASSEPMAYPSVPSVTAAKEVAGSDAPGGVPPASASRDAVTSSRIERAVASTDIEVWLEGVGISFVDDTPTEIAYLSATSLRVHIDTQPGSELAILQVADLQLDNQLANAPWPVLLWAPPPPPASPFDSSSTSVPGPNVLPATAHKPVLHIALDRFVFSGDSTTAEAAGEGQQRQQRVAMVKGAFAALQHLQLSLDEEFLLRAWMFVKSLKSLPGTEDDEDLSLEDGDHVGLAVPAVGADSLSGDAVGSGAMSWKRGPLYVECLLLCPIQLTVSLATARGTASFRGAGSGYRSMLRALLSAAGNVDRAELRFRALELHHALDTAPHFGHLVGEYYLAQLDAQKMALLSSSALVGNPSALFDSIAVGARDFFVEPARANGAADFIAGLGRGSSSLLTNTVGGLVGSLGGIPSAVALGLETAVGDRDYLAERESIRGRRGATSTPAHGLFTGALSFGHGLASGAAGLIREPVAGAMAGGPVGFLRGIGRGVVGGLVKPLAGALDLIGEPAAGFRAFISTERNRRAAEPVRPPRFFAPGPASRLVAFELRPALGDALLRALTREAVSEESNAAEPGSSVGLTETVVDWVDLSGDEHSARGGARERERLVEIWAVLRRCAFGGARDRGGGGGGGGAPSSLAAVGKTENEVLAAQWLAQHAHDRVALVTSRRFLVGTLHGRIHFARTLDGIVDAHVPAAAGADYVLLGIRSAGGDPSRPAAAEWQRLSCGSVASRNALHTAVRAAIGADGRLDAALTPRSARRAATAARRRQRDGSMEMVSFGSDSASARRMPSL